MILLGFVSADPASPAGAATPDRQILRDRLKLLWDSLGSIEIRCEEYVPEAEANPNWTGHHSENHFCHKKENFWFCDMRTVLKNGAQVQIYQIRQDGLRRQQVSPFDAFPDEISHVDINNQVSTPDNYDEAKFSALWLLLPGGRPAHVYLEAIRQTKLSVR